MSTEPIDSAKIMADHSPSWARNTDRGPAWCLSCGKGWPCEPRRLAEALAEALAVRG